MLLAGGQLIIVVGCKEDKDNKTTVRSTSHNEAGW